MVGSVLTSTALHLARADASLAQMKPRGYLQSHENRAGTDATGFGCLAIRLSCRTLRYQTVVVAFSSKHRTSCAQPVLPRAIRSLQH
jgi:hypothetical protein